MAGFEIVRAKAGLDLVRDFQLLVDPGVIFDVGANAGQTATTLSNAFPAAVISSFEPDREVFAALCHNVRGLRNVSCYPLALGKEDGVRQLFRTRNSVGNSLLPLAPAAAELRLGTWAEPSGEKSVEVRRLDSFCADHGIETIDLLKSDTQGAELTVLQGAGQMLRPSSIRAVVCELLFVTVYERQGLFEDIHSLLTGRGYRLVGFYNMVRDASHRLMWCDALYV